MGIKMTEARLFNQGPIFSIIGCRRMVILSLLGLVLFSSPGCKRNSQGHSSAADRKVDAAAIDAELARIRAAGEPVTLEDLDQMYAVPSKNAAEVYGNAFAALSGDSEMALSIQGHLPKNSEALSAPMRKEIEEFLAKNRDALALLHQAAGIAECRYPIDMKEGPLSKMTHWAKIRQCAQLLEIEAIAAADRDRSGQAAAEAVTTLLRLGSSLKNEPIEHSQWIRIYCDQLAFVAVERILNRVQLDESSLTGLLKAFVDAENLDGPTRALLGQRVLAIYLIKMPPDQRQKVMGKAYPSMNLSASFSNADFDFCLTEFRALITSSGASTPDRFSLGAALKTQITEAQNGKYPFSATMLPPFSELADKLPSYITRLRCVENVLAIEHYRLTHGGNRPAALDQLGAELPAGALNDPCSGKPFHYQQTGAVYEVASNGENDDLMVKLQIVR
jgi:hypothetical protein